LIERIGVPTSVPCNYVASLHRFEI